MKILIATGIFRPELGGPATFAAELASRLSGTATSPTVITYSKKPAYDFDQTYSFPLVRIVRGNSKILNYTKFFFAIAKRVPKYDLVYTLDWFSAGVPVMLACFLTRKKYIVRVGGGYIWEKYLAQGRSPVTLKQFYEKGLYKKYKLMFFMIKKVLKNAQKVIFNSDEQKDLYTKYYNIRPNKTAVIYNPVPEHVFGTIIASYKLRYAERDKELIFAGRFIKMKNIESLIKAFAKLNDQSFTLALIGEGPEEQNLKKLVKELQLENRVSFQPPMNQKDLYRRIANCYCVVIPSWTDISPNQAYECLALGIPFLITKENYLAINKSDFLKIDPASVSDMADKLNYLLDQNSYEDFAKSLSKLKFKRTWQDVLKDHESIFAEINH
jgi:glycosyltransferase involved in cell wall biosynthesis